MTNPIYYLTPPGFGGVPELDFYGKPTIGSGHSSDGHLPEGAIECTKEIAEAHDFAGYTISDGKLVPPSEASVARRKLEIDSANIRQKRSVALAESDGIVARHQDELLIGNGTTLTSDQIAKVLSYRKDLRDITDLPEFPNVKLPAKPEFVK